MVKILLIIIALINGANTTLDDYYKGKNPDNYILFNNEMWRILSVKNDTLKIIKDKSIGAMAFDNNNSNIWDNSSLKNYLNNEYYNKIDKFYRSMIIKNNDYINLITMEEYLKSNSNPKCDSLEKYQQNEDICLKTTFIKNTWTSTPDINNVVYYAGSPYFGDSYAYLKYEVLPVITIKNEIISGSGKLYNPFKLKRL